MKTSTSKRWWIAPVLAFLAGVVAAAGERQPIAPWAGPVLVANSGENAIDCQTREPIQFEFVALADLERQARESGTSHGSSVGK
jgi:hypothetical protein